MPTAASKLPGARRCLRVIEAHHLSCQGLSLSQIAEQMNCARSTVHAYLRDYRPHRAHAHQWETRIDPDGHERYLRGPKQGECKLFCPKCLDRVQAEFDQRRANRPDGPGSIESGPDQSPTDQDESGPIQTNLDKSEHLEHEFPAPDDEVSPIPQNSPPRRPPRAPRAPRADRRRDFTPPLRGNRVHVVP